MDDDDAITPQPRFGTALPIDELLRHATERLTVSANATLEQAAEVKRNTEALLAVKRAIYEREEAHDQRERAWAFTLEKIGRDRDEATRELATVLGDLRDRQSRMEAVLGIVERETTGAHRTLTAKELDVDDSGKTAAGAARRAWRDFLRAPTRSQFAALALVAMIAIIVLGVFAIRSNLRVAELERAHHEQKGP